MTPPPVVLAALRYGADRYAAGEFGKTLLVAWRAGTPVCAVAAGLASAQDRDRFAVLARYLLRREHADGYWLLLAAHLHDVQQLVAETVAAGRRRIAAAPLQIDADQHYEGIGEAVSLQVEAPLGDLLDGGAKLAGIMRRELDRLAGALAQPLPPVAA